MARLKRRSFLSSLKALWMRRVSLLPSACVRRPSLWSAARWLTSFSCGWRATLWCRKPLLSSNRFT